MSQRIVLGISISEHTRLTALCLQLLDSCRAYMQPDTHAHTPSGIVNAHGNALHQLSRNRREQAGLRGEDLRSGDALMDEETIRRPVRRGTKHKGNLAALPNLSQLINDSGQYL